MEFELKFSNLEGSEVVYNFEDISGDDLEGVVDSFKRFLYIAGYDITQFEEE